MREKKRHIMGYSANIRMQILNRSIKVLELFLENLKSVKKIADEYSDNFTSEGFNNFFEMIKKELNDDYFMCIQEHLEELRFPKGILISSELGNYNKGTNYVLRKVPYKKENWLKRIFMKSGTEFSFTIGDRDESGAKALSELRDKGINLVANALAQSTDHILDFFKMLRIELGFYIGCINLNDKLSIIKEPICFPNLTENEKSNLCFDELYDICLALTVNHGIVGNSLNAKEKDLMIITGANQGGKSTYLRSIGLAILMSHCGMFVPAQSFSSTIYNGLFTHFRKEEDTTMNSGKLDEELSRMNAIINYIKPNSLILFNESFAATNEKEGSEIAGQITNALLESGIKVIFVTHFYEFSKTFYNKNLCNAVFMRADRQKNGKRTFKIVEGKPLRTSFGEDLYNKVFSEDILE